MRDDTKKEDDFYDDIPIETLEQRPMEMNDSTFRQRNDPSLILQRFKLSLLNAYIDEEETTDPVSGQSRIKKKVKPIPGTKPLMNKQGVEECVSYLERFVNNHSVQTYYVSKEDFNTDMLYISQDITQHFILKRKDWGVDISQIDILIGTLVNQVEIFLRRGIENKERDGYNVTTRESNNRSFDDKANRSGVLSRFAKKFFGGS